MTVPPALSRRTLLAAAGLGAVSALTACGAASGSGSGGLVVTDQRHQRVRLSGPARRIVTIPIPAAAMLIAVDQGVDHLVGMHPTSATAIKEGILGVIFPDAKQIPAAVAGSDFVPNVEEVLGLHPDVVVQWADHGSNVIDPLVSAGLKVVGLDYGTQQDLEAWITIFGQLVGQSARSEELVRRMHTGLADVRAATAALTADRPKILYFLRWQESIQVAGADTYNDFCIDLVGGTNPARSVSGFTEVGPEQVLAWDPDIVVLGSFDGATPADVFGGRVWRDLAAVRTRRVYKAPLGGYRWDPPSHESPLMWRWLQQVAHPGGTAFDLRAAVLDDYRFLYGYSPTSSQVDDILFLDANGDSADYRQFTG